VSRGSTEPVATLGRPSADGMLFRPREELAALQDQLLVQTVALCQRAHPRYRELMRSLGLSAEEIRSTDDLQAWPVTEKKDFLADPEGYRLSPEHLSLEDGTVREVMYTTGTTTGRPAPVYTSATDYYAYLVQARRGAEILGLGSRDLIANVFPLTPFPTGGYIRANATAAAVGAGLLAAHPGRPQPNLGVHRSTDEVVRLVEAHRATVIWGIASFVRRLLLRADDLGADLSSVHAAWLTGEPISATLRENVRERMRALGCSDSVVVNRYGSTEGTTFVECADDSGWHNPAPDQIFLEVVDPVSGRRLGDGERGLLLITHLGRTGTLLVRYALGDLVALDHSTCPHCGRTAERIVTPPVRIGDLVKVKGALVSTEAMQAVLEQSAGIAEYQIVLRRVEPLDELSSEELLLRVALRPGANQEELEADVTGRFVRTTNVSPVFEWTTSDRIFDPANDVKPRRLVDERGTHSTGEGA
jgi:phenylacetate-coenzyme A ligase PaaK-like adenylate-forming protein